MNAHQRRIARRVVRRQLGESPSYEALYASEGDPFDDYDDEDEPEACPDCHGDGRDAMSDYLLPCKLCGGFGN